MRNWALPAPLPRTEWWGPFRWFGWACHCASLCPCFWVCPHSSCRNDYCLQVLSAKSHLFPASRMNDDTPDPQMSPDAQASKTHAAAVAASAVEMAADSLDPLETGALAAEELAFPTAKELGYSGAAFGATYGAVDETDP